MKKSTFFILIICFALVGGVAYYQLYLSDYAKESKAESEKTEEENIANKRMALARYDMVPACEDTEEYKVHQLSWKGYNGQQYEAELKVKAEDACKAQKYIKEIDRKYKKEERRAWDDYIREGSAYGLQPTPNDMKVVGMLYKNAIRGQMPYMEDIFESIESWKEKYKPSTRREFAEMIVSFVQNRPYVFVHTLSCEASMSENPAMPLLSDSIPNEGMNGIGIEYRYHIQPENLPCLPHHHSFTPIEFAYYLLGDCGIRTSFLYAVLSHFGYDVVIIVSPIFNHALLGFRLENEPLTGDYMMHNGQKYYFWETTVPSPIGLNPFSKDPEGFFVVAQPWNDIQ